MRPKLPSLVPASLLLGLAAGQGTPIGFVEDFALATDRTAVLEQLIPGTEESYFYRCLQHQHLGQYEEVETVLASWIQRHDRTALVREIENRQALLTFPDDPARSLEHVRQRIGLRFDHQRRIAGEVPDLPTRLDPALLDRARLWNRALQSEPHDVSGFRSAAYEKLVSGDLSRRQLGDLLDRLERPDAPGLLARVVEDLGDERSSGFGSRRIHAKLLIDQLDALAAQVPGVLDDADFLAAYLRRLRPSSDVDVSRNVDEERAHLERLQAFANRLSPAQNSLKAHVLYHRLRFDLRRGEIDRERFLAYLRLPREGRLVEPDYLKELPRRERRADLGTEFPTGLPPVRQDDDLIRKVLTHLFRTESSPEPYVRFLRKEPVERIFAETKILMGEGDMERWYSMLDSPSRYEALKARVEIDFPVTQRTEFAADEPVAIDVDLKNIDTLLVKVFEINALNYYQLEGREVGASIHLDGLIANAETTYPGTDNPLRRERRTFEFPELDRPGVFIVEFIGSGLSSRAVVRKGRLQYTERIGAAGHVLTVLDETGRPVSDASVRLGGRVHHADDSGHVVLPFSTQPGTRGIIIEGAGRTTLERFEHLAETYDLDAGVLVDREALLAGYPATLLVRPVLRLEGVEVDLSLLEDPRLVLVSTDLAGLRTTQVVRDLELRGDAEFLHTITVPPGLASLSVELRGRVRSISAGEDVQLSAGSQSFPVNGIRTTTQIASPMLGLTPTGFVLDLLGRNGEPIVDQALRVDLRHREVRETVRVNLKTDAMGRVTLGSLDGVTSLTVQGLGQSYAAWDLDLRRSSTPQRRNGLARRTLWVPLDGDRTRLTREVASLFEMRGDAYAKDRFANLRLEGGYLGLEDLPAGTYELRLKDDRRTITIEMTEGASVDGWGVGAHRMLELDRTAPTHLTGLGFADDTLEMRVANATDDTRVHVLVGRYLPVFDPLAHLYAGSDPTPMSVTTVGARSSYHAGREIGDEYRYILDRRFADKYPGNMLTRPGLILNPWALEETTSVIGIGGGADAAFGSRAGGKRKRSGSGAAPGSVAPSTDAGSFASLAYLPDPSVLKTNLRPGADGILRIPREELGGGHVVSVVVVDGDRTVSRTAALNEIGYTTRDLRLLDGLDPTQHLSQQRRIEFLDAGETVVVDDVAFSTAEAYDSLGAVFRLFRSLHGDGDLERFEPLTRWNALDRDAKLAFYDEHACHELHVFLHEKDAPFFDDVVRPYLANKAHKKFLDNWLLDADLGAYLNPWDFGQLNVVERILLSRRAGTTASGARHVRELWELVPPDPAVETRAFATAMRGAALDEKRGIGGRMRGRREDLREQSKALGIGGGGGGFYRGPGDTTPPSPAESPARAEGVDLFAMGGLVEDELMEVEEVEEDVEAVALDSLEQELDLGRRAEKRRLWRDVSPTEALAEHDYWHRTIEATTPELIPSRRFWVDFAEADPALPFRSRHFATCTHNLAETLLALAFLDLPFDAAEHDVAFDGARMTMRTAGPMLLLREDLQAADAATDEPLLLISQNFFRQGDRFTFVGNERRDKFVTDEFLVGVPYGCEVVLTNPTSTPRTLELLLQVPEGAMPLAGSGETIGRTIRLDAYETQSHGFAFYFPSIGSFDHYPAHVARDGRTVGNAESMKLNVVEEPSQVDTTSWEYVSQQGTPDQVVEHLKAANVQRLDLSQIAWRLKDEAFFTRVTDVLRAQHRYDATVWSYGVHHGDRRTVEEYLPHANGFLRQCGAALDTPVVTIDPVVRKTYQHLDFDPLINARTHRFGEQREILDKGLAQQYLALLNVLRYRPKLGDADWLAVTYYLLLQDRISEAFVCFARVDPDGLETRLQYDAMRAYMAFFTDDPRAARPIATAYADHPVPRWRNRFLEILSQLDEIEGGGLTVVDPEDVNQAQAELAAREAVLDLDVESGTITLDHANLEQCELHFYEMDIEFLFSTNPFVQQGSSAFAYIRPNLTQTVSLDVDGGVHTQTIPAQFASSNLMVEVRGEGVTRRQAHYANDLSLRVMENYGRLSVAHAQTRETLPKVYVKVFARLQSGETRFHKDGYTDHRGMFDYASLSAKHGSPVERFAVLVLSEDDGAVIREITPPVQ